MKLNFAPDAPGAPRTLDPSFAARWPFFGPWFLAVVDLAESRGMKIDNIPAWRTRYLSAQEPSQAFFDMQKVSV